MALTAEENAAIALVTIGGERAGTAFLVTPHHAITARHVVERAALPIELTFPGSKGVPASMVAGTNAKLDWALLACTPPVTTVPMRLRYFDRWHPNAWVSRGYGGLYGVAGGPISGQFYSESPLELYCPALTTEAAAKGFSGAPLVTSGGVVGVMSFTRTNDDGTVRAGYASAVTTGSIIADWPDKAAPTPTSEPAPYVCALQAYLEQLLTNEALRDRVARTMRLDTLSSARRVAERLVEEPWTMLKTLAADLANHAPEGLLDVISSMWVCRPAAEKLGELIRRNDAVTPGIRTKAYSSVRQHVMRAEGELDHASLITWGNDGSHIFKGNANSGEALTTVVKKALLTGLCIDEDELDSYLGQPMFKPMFVAINAIPTDADISAVRTAFGSHVMLIVHSENAANDVFRAKPLRAELIEPVPDRETETQAKVLASRPGLRRT